jgi:hypothetical protein
MSNTQNSAISRKRAPVPDDERPFTKLASSALDAVHYDAQKQALHVRFVSGGSTYEYADVSQADYDALLAAESAGRHFRQHILGRGFRRHAA